MEGSFGRPVGYGAAAEAGGGGGALFGGGSVGGVGGGFLGAAGAAAANGGGPLGSAKNPIYMMQVRWLGYSWGTLGWGELKREGSSRLVARRGNASLALYERGVGVGIAHA